jgi:hypothetical protein
VLVYPFAHLLRFGMVDYQSYLILYDNCSVN